MSTKAANRNQHRSADASQQALVRLIQSSAYGHHLYTVFSDFVELSAIAISNRVDLAQSALREKRYMDIVGKYKREEVLRFSDMFALLVDSFDQRVTLARKINAGSLALSAGLTDVLGQTFMMLGLGSERAGQFFTPYHLSQMMAMMQADGLKKAVEAEQDGFIRLQEPACGAGGMVIAMAASLLAVGKEYQDALHATCVDIDQCCVHMTYVQLSLLHVPAIVVNGNTISNQIWSKWYTPAHIIDHWPLKLRRRLDADLRREAVTLYQQAGVSEATTPDAIAVVATGDSESIAIAAARAERSDTSVLHVTETKSRLAEQSLTGMQDRAMFDRIDQLTLF